MEALRLCLVPAAARIDDHQSDAATIAGALAGACQTQWSVVVATSSKGKSPAVKEGLAVELQRIRPQVTLNAVLAERRSKISN
jgi:hypothetical protein